MSEEKTEYKLPLDKVQVRMGSQPIIECAISKSKDGEYVIFRTTITDIRKATYYKKVLEGDSEPKEEKSEKVGE